MIVSGTLTRDAVVFTNDCLREVAARARMQRCGHCHELMPRSRQMYCGTDCKQAATFRRSVGIVPSKLRKDMK